MREVPDMSSQSAPEAPSIETAAISSNRQAKHARVRLALRRPTRETRLDVAAMSALVALLAFCGGGDT